MSNATNNNKKMTFLLSWDGNRHPQECFKVDTTKELQAAVRTYCESMEKHCFYNEAVPVMVYGDYNHLGYIPLTVTDREDIPAPFYCDTDYPVDIPDRLSDFLKWWDGAPDLRDMPDDIDTWFDVYLEYIDD